MNTSFFTLLRYTVCENESRERAEELRDSISEMYSLAKKHELAQTVAYFAQRLGIDSPALAKETGLALFRLEGMKEATRKVSSALEEAGVPYILLKGAHMRELYPLEWLRSSCDIDVYVDSTKVDLASDALVKYGFAKGRRHTHDVMFKAPNGYTVELHFVLDIPVNVWEYSTRETEYRYKMNSDIFYCYHLVHMAEHIRSGGCGIRPFLDLWLIDRRTADTETRHKLCKMAGLERFEKCALRLSRVWFSGDEHTEITRELEDYIISGNAYGTKHNAAAVRGNALKYILGRLFMPYSQLKCKYPFLDGRPWLMPFYTVRRWFNLLGHKTAKSTARELKASRGISREEGIKAKKLLKNLEL